MIKKSHFSIEFDLNQTKKNLKSPQIKLRLVIDEASEHFFGIDLKQNSENLRHLVSMFDRVELSHDSNILGSLISTGH